MINSNQIALQVFEAIEGDKFLPINKKISLEYLNFDMGGIFENEKSWRSFINGNFVSEYDKTCWRDSVKDSTYYVSKCGRILDRLLRNLAREYISLIKKWTHAEKEYKHLFVIQIGKDKHISVAPEDVELEFNYELYYNNGSSFPSSVELFVTATVKG